MSLYFYLCTAITSDKICAKDMHLLGTANCKGERAVTMDGMVKDIRT